MSTQNMYNNYIKRNKQNSINQFRQKVANSLSGKAVGNYTTKKTTPTYGVSTLGVGNAPKPNTQTQSNTIASPEVKQLTNTTNTPTTPPTTQSNATHTVTQPINQAIPQNALGATTTPQNTTSDSPVGMMSLEDINKALSVENVTQSTNIPLTVEEQIQIEEMAQNPQVRSMAYASKKTPQQMAQELLTEMQSQAQKDWEMKKQELELQKQQFEQSSQQSKEDAEKTYLETVDKLNDTRYQQQQDLMTSGANRGIQYSPQQLGLENVANINHNKNLAEASKQRNELLNNLDIELGKALSNINLGLQNATNQYNQSISNLKADYMKQMMDWTYNDQQTADERKWQEEQAKKDRDFQKMMQELQNKWQAEQNALDRKKYGRSSGGGSGYSYGRSFTPYSSYKGSARSAYDNWGNYSNLNDLDLSSKEGIEAFGNTVEQYSTDLYNALDVGGMYDLNDRARVYTSEIDKYLDYAKKNGASKKAVDELEKTRKVATKHLFNKSYARDTNTAIKIGDTIHKSTTPLKDEYIRKTKSTKQLSRAKYDSVVARNKKERKQAKANESFFKNTGQGRTLNDLQSFAKKKAQSKKSNTPKKTTKAPYKPLKKQSKSYAKNTIKNTVKSSTMSKLNAGRKKSTNKKVTKPSTKSKFQKSFYNLKKNIKKLFGW